MRGSPSSPVIINVESTTGHPGLSSFFNESPHFTFLSFAAAALLFLAGGDVRLRAQARLSEFLAVNTAGAVDEAGQPQPWAEVWNASLSNAINLNGYQLRQGGASWEFPAVRLLPGMRLVVWMSGEDRREPTAPLHAGFRPAVEGGSLELYDRNGVLVSALADYPPQQANVSWGREETDAAATPALVGRYEQPTPGERNNFLGSGVAPEVAFSVESRAFTGALTVALEPAAAAAGAVIRYSTDLSVPTADSPVYTEPLVVSSTQMIRARVFHKGLLPGKTGTRAYLRLGEAARDFTTTMPVVAISNFIVRNPPDVGNQPSYVWCWEPSATDGIVRLNDPPTLASRLVMDRRGSSTLGNPKFNLNIETRNEWDEDESDVALLGMAAHSDWVMHAPYDFDPALIRNPFAFGLSRSIGRYAPDARLAEVFIDVNGGDLSFAGTGGSANDYYGIYNIVEKVRRNKDRVAVRKMEVYDNGEPEISGGYIWKIDRLDAGDAGFSVGGVTMAYYYPKEVDLKLPQRAPQKPYLTDYVTGFYRALMGADWKDPELGYARWLDVDAAVDHHLLNLWVYNVDSFALSAYWHKDAGGKMTAGPVWDFDRALGSTDGRDSQPAGWGIGYGGSFFHVPWWARLFNDIDFYQKYIDRWEELRRGAFSPAAVNALLDGLNSKMPAAAVARDLSRWSRPKRPWQSPFTQEVFPAGQQAEIQRMKDYLQLRADFFDSQWVGPVDASQPPGFVLEGAVISLSGPDGAEIYYTLNGSDPRPSGGGAPLASARRWEGTPLSLTRSTRLRARAWKPSHAVSTKNPAPPLISQWGGLSDFYYSVEAPAAAGDVVVTELNFNPPDPTEAETAANALWENNNFEFIELRNTGSRAVDLAGARFTAGVTFEFPGGGRSRLAPGEQLVVCSDPAAFAARYGQAIRTLGPWAGNLSNSGERLLLQAKDDAVIQDFFYDDAWSRAADKGGYSLVVYDPWAEAFSTAGNWRTSAAPLGSPGAYDPMSAPCPVTGTRRAGPLTGVALPGVVLGGQSTGGITAHWSFVEGPGDVAFSFPDHPAASAVFTEPGRYVLRLTATDGFVTRSDDLQVFVQDTPERWIASRPELGALGDDPDGDGLNNLLEFALDTDPLAPQPGAGVSVTTEHGRTRLAFSRLTPPSGLAYEIEASSDLLTFEPVDVGGWEEELLSDEGFRQHVGWLVPQDATTPPTRFFRLHVRRSP